MELPSGILLPQTYKTRAPFTTRMTTAMPAINYAENLPLNSSKPFYIIFEDERASAGFGAPLSSLEDIPAKIGADEWTTSM